MNEDIFKANDIRGVYPTHLNESIVPHIAQVLASDFKEKKVVLAHDGRYGSKELYDALTQAIGQYASLEMLGLSTTPMFYFAVRDTQAAGGIMVTASHNPKEYTGLKIVGGDGKLISGNQILERIKSL